MSATTTELATALKRLCDALEVKEANDSIQRVKDALLRTTPEIKGAIAEARQLLTK